MHQTNVGGNGGSPLSLQARAQEAQAQHLAKAAAPAETQLGSLHTKVSAALKRAHGLREQLAAFSNRIGIVGPQGPGVAKDRDASASRPVTTALHESTDDLYNVLLAIEDLLRGLRAHA